MGLARHLEGKAGLAIMVGLSLVGGVVIVSNTLLVSAPTLWAHHVSSLLLSHPADVAFLPGASPLSALAYSPFAALGLDPFRFAHLTIVPLTLVLVAGVARARAHSSPNLAALIVFASPALLAAGSASVPGADAALLVALALYCLDVLDKPRLGGALFGLLVLIRPELLIIALGVGIARRRKAVLLAATTFAVAYAALGVLLTGGGDWLVDVITTPALAGPPAPAENGAVLANEAAFAIITLCPAIGLVGFLPDTASPMPERADAVVATVFVAVVIALGVQDVGAVGLGPERLVPALPLIAPLVARALTHLCDAEVGVRGVALLAALLLLAIVVPGAQTDEPLVAVIACWALLVTLVRVAPRFLLPLVVIGVFAGVELTSTARLSTEDQTPGLDDALTHLREDASIVDTTDFVTDAPLLALLLPESDAEVAFLWRGRAAEPLGIAIERSDELSWLLVDHPFGAPEFDARPTMLAATGLAVIADPSLREAYDASPEVNLIFGGPVGIYERLGAQARASAASRSPARAANDSPNSSGVSTSFQTSQAVRVSVSSKNAATGAAAFREAPARRVCAL